MTEIPEHLLKRSRERREAASGGASSSSSDATPATTSSTPAVAKPAAPAVASAPVPKPDPSYVVAAKSRKKIPFWAMATLSLLPLWAFMYMIALKPQEKTVEGPLAIGEAVFGSCAGCHGAAGQGGAGRVFAGGEVLKTFPKIEDMLNFVYTGSQAFVAAEIPYYGNPDREGGAHAPLSYNAIAGADPTSEEWKDEYETWCSPESEIFLALENGATSFDTVDKDFAMLAKPPLAVGTKARASSK